MTPDSSRFWPADGYQPGQAAAQLRQAAVARLARCRAPCQRWNGDAPPPKLPAEVVDATSKRYLEAYRRLTGSELKVS